MCRLSIFVVLLSVSFIMMSDHPGEVGRRSMPEIDREYLENLVTLLGEAGNGVPEEPLTLHRRGQWFKSTTAHHTVQ